MGKNTFDVGIIGCGVAGTFAALKIAEKYKNCKTIVWEIGRPPMKRRRFLEGFLGCFPTGNGRIYPNDLDHLRDLMDGRKVAPVNRWVMRHLKDVNPMRLVKDSAPSAATRKVIESCGFDFKLNDYYQWKPKSVHQLSRLISEKLDDAKNIQFSFDTFVHDIEKKRRSYVVYSERGTLECKRLIICVGRSGWRWVNNLYNQYGLVEEDDWALYGARVELPANMLKYMNKSHCILNNNKDLTKIGPFNWNGTVIPEDHSDLVLSAFRSNEDRWKTEKVSFSLLKAMYYPEEGCAQSDRIGKLAFLLFNDRVSKEKVSSFLKNKSILSLLPEYEWLSSSLENIEEMIPGICAKGYLHVPHISPMASRIKIGDNLETELRRMYVAGESARIPGILGAAVSGAIAVNNACEG